VTEGPQTAVSVLYVEDDERLARLTARYLESHGLRVTVVPDGTAGIRDALRLHPDVILLDLMLPGVDGMEVCRRLRERIDTPIIMVTAHGEESDRVLGLEGGADDYIGKPFSSRELLARIRAQARRARGQAGPAGRAVVVGSLRIEPQAMRATLEGRELGLTTYEFTLLRILAERAGRVLGRGLDARLDADRMLLRRVLDNLLDNAAKHSESSTPVTLAARVDEQKLWIEVRDQGRGIAPDDLRNLFTPFFRADRSRARQTGGLGLGLLLARRIVEAHRGSLEIESAPQRGTVARVRVPLAA